MSNTRTLTFVVILCFIAALILSLLASSLKAPQERAQEVYRSTQLLIAAHILDFEGNFVKTGQRASESAILKTYTESITPMLVQDDGTLTPLSEEGRGHLIYVVNGDGYVIPVRGFGLWDAIYGYLGVAKNGDTVIGMTWYDQKETPGLGGEISNPEWEKQFYGKVIFQKNPDGSTNYARAPLGIRVVKGTVAEVLGNTPAADSAVDGISGATITVTGVNEAIKKSLKPYRNFLIKVHHEKNAA